MKIIVYRVSLFLFVVLNVFACKSGNTEKFYTDKGEWDTARIPLLKPYEAINVNKEDGWCMNLFAIDGDTGFDNIKRITVVNGIIITYSENSILDGVDVKQSWHVIIPGKKLEKGFNYYAGYLKYLSALGLKEEPHLHDINLVAKYFEENDSIDWKSIK